MTEKSPAGNRPTTAVPDPTDEPLTSVIAGRRDNEDEVGGAQFQSAPDAQILCLTCRQHFPAADQRADDIDRLEGASDPADMAMVLPVRCPRCDANGTLVLRYGPEASAEETDLLLALERRPADRGRPPSAPTSLP